MVIDFPLEQSITHGNHLVGEGFMEDVGEEVTGDLAVKFEDTRDQEDK